MNVKVSQGLKRKTKKAIFSTVWVGSFLGLGLGLIDNKVFLASPFEFHWDAHPDWVKLKYYQTNEKKLQKGEYYLFLRPRERKTGILKLSIKVPDYFDRDLKPSNFKLCQVKVGGYSERTKCLKDIPAVFEITQAQTSIEIFPNQPIPLDEKTYAVLMKIKNPRRPAMFQFHAYAQSPGAVPISGYLGTWSFEVQDRKD